MKVVFIHACEWCLSVGDYLHVDDFIPDCVWFQTAVYRCLLPKNQNHAVLLFDSRAVVVFWKKKELASSQTHKNSGRRDFSIGHTRETQPHGVLPSTPINLWQLLFTSNCSCFFKSSWSFCFNSKAEASTVSFSFLSSGWWRAATGHPGVCAHIAVIPCCSTAEISSTQQSWERKAHDPTPLLSFCHSHPNAAGGERGGVEKHSLISKGLSCISDHAN